MKFLKFVTVVQTFHSPNTTQKPPDPCPFRRDNNTSSPGERGFSFGFYYHTTVFSRPKIPPIIITGRRPTTRGEGNHHPGSSFIFVITSIMAPGGGVVFVARKRIMCLPRGHIQLRWGGGLPRIQEG